MQMLACRWLHATRPQSRNMLPFQAHDRRLPLPIQCRLQNGQPRTMRLSQRQQASQASCLRLERRRSLLAQQCLHAHHTDTRVALRPRIRMPALSCRSRTSLRTLPVPDNEELRYR